jgi:hypothetical protein
MPVKAWCDDRTRCVPSAGSATGDASTLLQRLVERERLGAEVTRHPVGVLAAVALLLLFSLSLA